MPYCLRSTCKSKFVEYDYACSYLVMFVEHDYAYSYFAMFVEQDYAHSYFVMFVEHDYDMYATRSSS